MNNTPTDANVQATDEKSLFNPFETTVLENAGILPEALSDKGKKAVKKLLPVFAQSTEGQETLSIDAIPGQDKLTDYEKGVLKEHGISLSELTAKDIEAVMLMLPAHADRLDKIRDGAAIGDESGAIEKALNDDGPDDDDTPQQAAAGKKTPDIIYDGDVTEPVVKADKTPTDPANSNDESSSFVMDLKSSRLPDARERYGDDLNWVTKIMQQKHNEEARQKNKAAV